MTWFALIFFCINLKDLQTVDLDIQGNNTLDLNIRENRIDLDICQGHLHLSMLLAIARSQVPSIECQGQCCVHSLHQCLISAKMFTWRVTLYASPSQELQGQTHESFTCQGQTYAPILMDIPYINVKVKPIWKYSRLCKGTSE